MTFDYLNLEQEYDNSPRKNSLFRVFREVVYIMLIVMIFYVFLNMAIPRFVVEGHSMEPGLHTSEYVLVSRVHYVFEDPQRGDVIVFHLDATGDLIKRIIGLPGEHIEMKNGRIFVNGRLLEERYIEAHCRLADCRDREWLLQDDEYFVLGDNRNNSNDSHNFGPIHRSQIVGKALLSYWPPDDWQLIFTSD